MVLFFHWIEGVEMYWMGLKVRDGWFSPRSSCAAECRGFGRQQGSSYTVNKGKAYRVSGKDR